MNNNDERDYAEEAANRQILETGDEERMSPIDDGPRHWITNDDNLDNGGGVHGIGAYEEDRVEQIAPMHVYYFTFGVGHKLIACLPEHGPADPDMQSGFSLSGYYVKIEATDEMEARIEMIRCWGPHWSSCYSEIGFDNIRNRYKELNL